MSVVATGVGLAVGVDPAELLGRRGLLYRDRATQLGLCAARAALLRAGLLDDSALNVGGDDFGVVVSSNFGNVDTVCRVAAQIGAEGAQAISPMGLPNASSNVVASSISIRFGLRGPNLMLCNGATSGLDAVQLAGVLIRAGRARRVLVVGAETDNDVVRSVVGHGRELLDGAVGLVLESTVAARERGAEPLGTLGRYAIGAGVDRCVARLTRDDERLPELWLVPEGSDAPAPVDLDGVARHDVSATFGSCSGALGVLQCATALAWLGDGAAERVLATAGGADGEPVAGLVLTAPDRDRRSKR